MRREGSTVITIEEFQKIDLCIGTVMTAAPHPNADRLLVLQVRIGDEERQVVAGIRAHYDPAALIGRQVVVVANLQPATLRGVESRGMILAASVDDRLVLVGPERPIPSGTTVR
jgi:methionine--tRNA ligase beta chain